MKSVEPYFEPESMLGVTPQAGFKPAQNMISGIIELICTVVITTTDIGHQGKQYKRKLLEKLGNERFQAIKG